jgi:hypothetical protein
VKSERRHRYMPVAVFDGSSDTPASRTPERGGDDVVGRFEADDPDHGEDGRGRAGKRRHERDEDVEQRRHSAGETAVEPHESSLEGRRRQSPDLEVPEEGRVAGLVRLRVNAASQQNGPDGPRSCQSGTAIGPRATEDGEDRERSRSECSMTAPDHRAQRERRPDERFHPNVSYRSASDGGNKPVPRRSEPGARFAGPSKPCRGGANRGRDSPAHRTCPMEVVGELPRAFAAQAPSGGHDLGRRRSARARQLARRGTRHPGASHAQRGGVRHAGGAGSPARAFAGSRGSRARRELRPGHGG